MSSGEKGESIPTATGALKKREVLKIGLCRKFTGNPCQSAITIKLQLYLLKWEFGMGVLPVNFLHIFNTIFPKNTPTSSRLFLKRTSEISFFKINLSLGEQPQNEIWKSTKIWLIISSQSERNISQVSDSHRFTITDTRILQIYSSCLT